MAMLVTIHRGVVEDGRWAKGYIQNKTWYDNIWHACAIQYIYIYYIHMLYYMHHRCFNLKYLNCYIYIYIYMCGCVCIPCVYIYIYIYVFLNITHEWTGLAFHPFNSLFGCAAGFRSQTTCVQVWHPLRSHAGDIQTMYTLQSSKIGEGTYGSVAYCRFQWYDVCFSPWVDQV